MHAVGDGAHAVAREDLAGRRGMALGDAVHPPAQAQRQPRHVEMILAGEALDLRELDVVVEQPLHERIAELVEGRFHRRVRRENTALAHRHGIVGRFTRLRVFIRLPEVAQQVQRQQRGVPFVEMIGVDVEAERLQHARAADTEHDLLLEPVGVPAAIEVVGDLPVLRAVLLDVGIEQQHRHLVPERTGEPVEPRPDPHLAALDPHSHHGVEPVGVLLGRPRIGSRHLAALGVDFLPHVAGPAHQADEHHGQLQVRGRTRGVARQHAETAGIAVHLRAQRDLHGDVGNAAALQKRFDRIHDVWNLSNSWGDLSSNVTIANPAASGFDQQVRIMDDRATRITSSPTVRSLPRSATSAGAACAVSTATRQLPPGGRGNTNR